MTTGTAPRGRRLRTRARRRLARLRRTAGPAHVALTFDDGPSDHTDAVLDVLAAHEVPATFFVVGRNAQRDPRLVTRMVAEGHAVGSHTYSHPDPATLSVPALFREYRDGRRAVEDVAARPVPLFRPPHGRMGRLGSVVARATGVQTWLWTRDPGDWEPGLTADQLVARLHPLHAGDVVVLHDGMEQPLSPAAVDRTAMVEGLDAFLAGAATEGLTFASLDTLPAPDRPRTATSRAQ